MKLGFVMGSDITETLNTILTDVLYTSRLYNEMVFRLANKRACSEQVQAIQSLLTDVLLTKQSDNHWKIWGKRRKQERLRNEYLDKLSYCHRKITA